MSDLVEECGHCGRTGTLTSVKNVVVERKETAAYLNDEPVDAEEQTVVEISRCHQCGQLTFTRYGWLDPFFDEPSDAANVTQLYPAVRNGSDLPERVAIRYAEMLQQIHEPGLFAVQAGRLLEAVCRERGIGPKGANGKPQTLYKRLGLLVSSNHLPKGLGDQADLVRQYRNMGGHDDDLEATDADVPLIRLFAEAILEFLYWGPARLDRGASELKRRRDALDGN